MKENRETALSPWARGVDGTEVSYPGADGGAVGGSSRRERCPVPGTAPLRKNSVISNHFPELALEITVVEMHPEANTDLTIKYVFYQGR